MNNIYIISLLGPAMPTDKTVRGCFAKFNETFAVYFGGHSKIEDGARKIYSDMTINYYIDEKKWEIRK